VSEFLVSKEAIMKGLVIFTFFSLLISCFSFADIGDARIDRSSGTAAVDEKYLDTFKDKAAVQDKAHVSEDKLNVGYDHLDSKRTDQQGQEEKPIEQKTKGRD
jgi:hypothetical protein